MSESMQQGNERFSGGKQADHPRRGDTGGSGGQEKEERSRRHAFIALGVFVLIPFFFSVLEWLAFRIYDGWAPFGNIVFFPEEAPPLVKFFFLYSLLAGVATIVLAIVGKRFWRSIAFMGIGLAPLLTLIGSQEMREALGSQHLLGQLGTGIPVIYGGLLGALAMVAIYAGSRARSFRPNSSAAAVVGAFGGGAYLLGLLLPIQAKELGVISVVTPLRLIFSGEFEIVGMRPSGRIFAGVMGLLHVCFLIAAAILCLRNAGSRPNVQRRARYAFTFWIGSILAAGPVFFCGFINRLWDTWRPECVWPAPLDPLRMSFWILGIYLLIPMGATDLIVSASGAAAAEIAAIPASVSVRELQKRLESLKKMLDDGLISQEDYDKKKDEVLSKM